VTALERHREPAAPGTEAERIGHMPSSRRVIAMRNEYQPMREGVVP
jgi:hypothetical protein